MASEREYENTLRVASGLFLTMFTIFATLSLISFLFTWIQDQSLGSDPGFFTPSVSASNWGGKLGYSLADFLFARLFGFGAFAVPVFSGISAVACFRIRRIRLGQVLLLCLFGCIVISLAFSYFCSFSPAYIALFGQGTGGSYGYYINEWLVSMLGAAGTGCVVIFALALWGMCLSARVTGWISAIFDKAFAPRGKKISGTAGQENGAAEEVEQREDEAGPPAEPEEEPSSEEPEPDDDGPVGEGDEIPFTVPDEIIAAGEEEKEEKEEEGTPPAGEENIAPEETDPAFVVVQSDDPDTMPEATWRERYDPRLSLSRYKLPSTELMDEYRGMKFIPTRDELEQNNLKIVQALKSYKIAITKVSAKVGPTVTLFEVVPAPGVKVSQIKSREEDIARELAAVGVRVVFIPGSNAIGIEVANAKSSIVSMRSVLEDPKFRETRMELPIAIGKTISNETMIFDLAKMPHLLVAGATGQGKSVGLNAIITSLLYKKHPSELKLVLVDPKKVELSLYSPIENHYLAKLPDSEEAIITDTDRVVYTLKSLCKLMDRRYNLLKEARVRNIKEYNEKFLSRQLNPLKGHDYMPYIVVIIDEFADLLMTAGRDVEEPITRLAQLARAIGIHLVIATQRPTTNIITGTIKANFPARIAFKVMTGIDSKTILDQTGANRLIGRGDMLISTGSTEPIRVQCALVDTPEVSRLTEFIHGQAGFGTAYLLPEYHPEGDDGSPSSGPAQRARESDRDELFDDAAMLVVREQTGSTSLLQRKMEIGFARAGRLMDQLHEAGIVGPSEGSKARQVRVTTPEALERILDELHQNS